MKIAFVTPKNSIPGDKSFYDYEFIQSFTFSKKYFSYLLAIPTLLSITPKEHEVRIFDENVEPIDYSWKPDLVGISVRTMFANRAYEISDEYRRRGIKTVLGGIHPSMCQEDSLEHCDTIVVGEAEGLWPTLLSDAQEGKMKRIYRAEGKTVLSQSPVADRIPLSDKGYFADIIQTTKGCPFVCDFCSVYAFDGQKIRSRTLDQVLREIKESSEGTVGYKKKSIFFADDNIIANKKYAKELFKALIPLKINWSCQASINISKEEELLKLMKESGCGSILVGLETVSPDNLAAMDKGINLKYDYLEAIEKIQSHGILVHGSFIVGSDVDDHKTFDDLVDFIEKSNLLMPVVHIMTPFPGTKLFERYEEEGRILHKDWSRYDAKTVVFKPSNMTAEELLRGHRRVLRRLYSFDAILRKLRSYWKIDFWKHSNEIDPIRFKYRALFALRLCTLLFSTNMVRSVFILKLLPHVFQSKVRISTILTMMAYNDYAYSLHEGEK